jgi:flagellar export protein FliJ
MRSLDALIRLARFKVEELQKQMASLDEARGALQRQIDQLNASVPEEQVAASAAKDGFLAYGSYAQAVIQRRNNLRASVGEVEAQAGRLRAALTDAFVELKKFETMEERRRATERAERRTREQARLDDLANIRAAG